MTDGPKPTGYVRNGTYRWFQDWNLLLRDKQGVPQKIQGIIMDITKEKIEQSARILLQEKLQGALEKILSGFIPICAKCKKIRDDKGSWHQIEEYIRDHSDADFTHGLCPECAEKHTEI